MGIRRNRQDVVALAKATTALVIMVNSVPVFAQATGNPGSSGSSAAQDDAGIQTTGQPGDDVLGVGEIVVTAQRRSESINKVGMSISAVSGDTLAKIGVVDTEQLVKVVPGFNFTKSAYGQPILTIRGVGFNETSLAAAPAVTAYVDEVPLPSSVMTEGVGLDLERVEVLKGPQGTLFGQNSTGGAINFIAAKPTATPTMGFDVTVGRFNTVNASGFVSGPLSDTLRVRVAARKEYGDGWQRSATRPGDTMGATDRFQGRVLLEWRPSDRTSFLLNVNGWINKSEPQAGQLAGILNNRMPRVLAAQQILTGDARLADWDPDTRFFFDNDFYQIALNARFELSDSVALTNISAYSDYGQNQYLDADGTPLQAFGARGRGAIKTISQELRLGGEIGTTLNWVVGANYQNEKIRDAAAVLTGVSSYPFRTADAVTRNTVDTYSGFASVDWEFAPSLTATVGGRYSWQNRAFAGCLYDTGDGTLSTLLSGVSTRLSGTPTTIPLGGCVTLSSTTFKPQVFLDELNEGSFSWKLGLNWEIASNKLLYATVSKGYKNGAYITAGATTDLALRPATQESVVAYETGFKFGLFNRTVQLNGAAFYYDYRDKQTRGRVIDPVVGAFNRLLNIPRSRGVGGELQLIWEPVSGLSINVGGTYIDTKILGNFVNFTPLLTSKRLSGEALPLSPKWQLTSDVQYDFPVSGDLNVFAGANATYQGATNAALGDEPQFYIKAYTLVDVRLGVHDADNSWRLSAFVQNVGNAYYWNNVAAPSADVAFRLAGRPRSYGLTGSLRFK